MSPRRAALTRFTVRPWMDDPISLSYFIFLRGIQFISMIKNPPNELYKPDLFKTNNIIAMIFLSLLAVMFQMHVLLLVSIIAIAIVARKALKQQSIKHIQSVLYSCDWDQHHRIIRDALQYLKYSMMIARGYHSKSNTNIILQEEKEKQQHNQQGQAEEIAKQLVKVVELLGNLNSLKRELMQEDKISIGYNQQKIRLNTFSQMFATSRQVDLIIQDLSKMSLLFKERVLSPAHSLENNDFSINKWETQMLPALFQLDTQVQNLTQIYNRLLTELALTAEFREAYQAAINRNPDENAIQALQKFINKCEELLPAQQPQQILENQTIELAFGTDKNEKEKLQPITSQSQQVNAFERKEFLRRLDLQLMIGLVRKRQALL